MLGQVNTRRGQELRLVVCDLSASPFMDLSGAAMLHKLHDELAARHIALRILDARSRVRELLRADGLADKVGGIERGQDLASLVRDAGPPARP